MPIKYLRKLYLRYFPKYRRLECRFVNYSEGAKLIHGNAGLPESQQWRVAPEEDRNGVYGYVHLERRERITA